MPQMISRNTVLLQGAGRTNIEYSAGPNINITNDVISGRDWSNEIAKGGASAVSSHLSAGDHIDLNTNSGGITTISVTGDFYSAGDNINITNNVISGKDWTNDIDSHIESAISGKADASAIPEIVDYSAGDNINITDHVISGKDWSYEIGQKADRSEVIERISAASESIVNNLTETISSTSSELYDIISATSGQGGGSCPWISGGKDYGSATVQLNFGDTIPVFSSWGLSADHNHYIWMKGAYVRLPDGSEFLPNSAFSSYTASMAANMSSNWNYTNSAYSMAISNTYNKLDNSAFSAYTAAHSADDVIPYSGGNGIEVNDHVISFTGEAGSNYSAGANIDITDNVISGKDWNNEILSSVSAASAILNQMIASGDNVAYSAGNNINITDHVVSGKDWSNEIASSTSGKLDSSWTAGKDVTPYSAGSNINVTNHVISGKDWTSDIDSHIASAISGIEVPSSKPVSGTSGIKIEETENAVVFSISGDVGKTYSAGSNIYISNQNVISGRDWSTNINSATSGKLDSSWTAGKDVTPYSAGSNINITNHVVSGKDWSSDIDSAISSWSAGQTFGKIYTGISPINVDNVNDEISLDPPEWTLCAGPNIHISADSLTENLYVSGKDWTDDITSGISAWSAGQTFGSDYTSPSGTIIVDNDNSTVEATTSGLLTSSYFAPSATDFGPISILASQTYGLHKIVDNFISGQVLSAWSPWQSPEKMLMLVMDNDSTVVYSGTPTAPSTYAQPWSIPYTANSSGYNLYISGSDQWMGGESPIKGKAYSAVEVTGYGVVDLYNNYSAGPGISIENHVISAGAGNKVSYWYNTPVTGISSDGDLLISRSVAAATPDKIRVQVGSSDVGLLVPTNTGHNSMLVTNSMGSVQWEAQSAIIPSAAEQAHKVRVYSNDATYSGENALNDYPSLDHDWEFTIINQYDNSAHWLYYSALGGTATLNPGRGVRVYYCQNTNTLYSEPEFVTDFGDDYATQWGDLGGLKLREVGTSAQASGNGILYVITGGN